MQRGNSQPLSRSLSRASTISKDQHASPSLGRRSKTKKVFYCPMDNCGRVFDRKYNMQIHIRKHTGEMPYQCRVEGCGLKFKWRSSLVNHNRKHKTGKLPGPPDPTLPGVSDDDVAQNQLLLEDPLLERQFTDPGSLTFEETGTEDQFCEGAFVQPSSHKLAGDLATISASQQAQLRNEPLFEDVLTSDTHTNMNFADNSMPLVSTDVAEDTSGAGLFNYPPMHIEAAQETIVDNDFIDRFCGALTCEYDTSVAEEALANPFASPVSDGAHVPEGTGAFDNRDS